MAGFQADARMLVAFGPPASGHGAELARLPHSRLDMAAGGRRLGGMESHEWNERTEEGKRFFRANFHGNTWRIMTTLKTDPDWEILEQPSEEVWRELRDVVWKKYQRKRCPWERVASIDKILGDEVPE